MAVSCSAPSGAATSSGWLGDRQYRVVLACVCGSLMLHAGVLALQGPGERVRTAATGSEGRQTLRTRLITATAAESASSSTALKATPHADAPAPSPAKQRKHPAPAAQKPVEHGPFAEPVSASPPPSPVDDHGAYIPRPLLSVAPIVQAPVVLETPSGEAPFVRYTGILSLFIDEAGHVQHIAADEPRLPPAFEQAARDAFMKAEYSPGQLNGSAVKSRVRVEVVFEGLQLGAADGADFSSLGATELN